MNADQLKIFQDITLGYFAKVVPEERPPVLSEAYLRFDSAVFLDYTSVVHISGAFEGCIYITASPRFLETLLAAHHEPDINDRTRLDMCRELSNVLAGNASHAFGANWTISVPQSLTSGETGTLALPPSTFVMPFQWKDMESYLVVGLKEKELKEKASAA
jgi:CheY-specific phosphatase CheX